MFGYLFGFVDQLFAFAPVWLRLTIWGFIYGAGTMLGYGAFSDQERISEIGDKVDEAQEHLRAYDGTDLSEVMSRAKESIRLSFEQMKVMFGPAMAAGIPILLGLVWMGGAYTYQMPEPGTEIEAEIHPAADTSGDWSWQPDDAIVDRSKKTVTLKWPSADGNVRLVDTSDGETLLRLPPSHARATISKHAWHHWLYANPAGYLPADSPVASVHFELPHQTVLPWGPWWLSSWHVFFLTILSVWALIVKVAFGID
ncbi:MAG: hypothetical protein ABEN55_06140 [Bradymonadaceae bacterium]